MTQRLDRNLRGHQSCKRVNVAVECVSSMLQCVHDIFADGPSVTDSPAAYQKQFTTPRSYSQTYPTVAQKSDRQAILNPNWSVLALPLHCISQGTPESGRYRIKTIFTRPPLTHLTVAFLRTQHFRMLCSKFHIITACTHWLVSTVTASSI